MNCQNYLIERIDSNENFKKKVQEDNVKVYGVEDELNNTFEIISILDKNFIVGIMYYDCNLTRQILVLGDVLILGFEQYIISIDIVTNELIYEKKILSLVYQFIQIGQVVVIVCELEVYGLSVSGKYLWSLGFRDIVEDFEIVDNINLLIQTSDNEIHKLEVQNGRYID